MRSARRIGQRILMLHEGRIYADQSPEEIFKSTRSGDLSFRQWHCGSHGKPALYEESRLNGRLGCLLSSGLALLALLILNFSKGVTLVSNPPTSSTSSCRRVAGLKPGGRRR